MQRIQYIDRLKGLTILLVVMGHVFGFHQPEDGIYAFFGTFRMPLFMFLSGLVIAAPPRLSKVLKKWRRFLVPFFVVGLACTFYRHDTIAEFLKDGGKGGYWYLWVLALFYLVLSLFRCGRTGRKGVVLDLGLFVIADITMKMLAKVCIVPGESDILSLQRSMAMWPFFMAGYFARKYDLLRLLRKYSFIATLALVAFMACFSVIERYNLHFGHYNRMAGMAIIVVLVYLFSSREHSASKVENHLAFIGRHSLEVYIFHYFFLYNIHVSFIQSWALETHNGLIELLFLVAMSLAVTYLSILVGWFFHQEKWLQRIVYGG